MNYTSLTRKVVLKPLGDKAEIDRIYKYLRDGMYNQNRAYNILVSTVYMAMITGKSKEEIGEIYKKGQRNPKEGSPEYSLYNFEEITFAKGLPSASSLCMQAKADIKKDIKAGLLKGKCSVRNMKLDAPLWVEHAYIKFYYEEENYQDFLEKFMSNKTDLFLHFVNGINFRIDLGTNARKSHEIRCVFQMLLEGFYQLQRSSIQIDGKKIVLNMTAKVPDKSHELDQDIAVGVDLGLAIPAMCALNNDTWSRLSIGSIDDFLRERTKIKAQRRRLQSGLKYSNGGHGRAKKLQAMDRYSEYERNWVKNYNHMVSRRVVDFALKNNASTIKMECLKGFDDKSKKNFVLSNWSYYQLQQYITYKAEHEGISVVKINPYHTSQTCSFCGHWEEGQRLSQKNFICKNPECKKYGVSINADWNAARNIAMSTDYMEEDK